MCEDFAPNFGDKRTGCCITTTHRFSAGNILLKTTWLLSPPYLSLLPKLKINPEGRHSDTNEAIQAGAQAVLNILTEHGFEDKN
jgi:hypothetical protein